MSDELHKFVDMAQGLKRDLDELGVTKPPASSQEENDEAIQLLFSAGAFMPKASQPPTASEDIRAIIRRWRDLVERRAYKYMDGPGDFIGRMLLDEVAVVDAWLKEQEIGAVK